VGVRVRELSRYLFLAGALPFLLLGTAHVVHTPRLPSERKGLSPSDPSLAEVMTRSRVLLTGRTDMWRVWVGFNLSHSLGILLFGAVVVLVGRTPVSFGHNAAIFLPLAVVVSLTYLSLGLAYWFRTPLIGISVSVVLFSAAWALHLVGRG
jgi:predicted RND superfamily exporter protein